MYLFVVWLFDSYPRGFYVILMARNMAMITVIIKALRADSLDDNLHSSHQVYYCFPFRGRKTVINILIFINCVIKCTSINLF